MEGVTLEGEDELLLLVLVLVVVVGVVGVGVVEEGEAGWIEGEESECCLCPSFIRRE